MTKEEIVEKINEILGYLEEENSPFEKRYELEVLLERFRDYLKEI